MQVFSINLCQEEEYLEERKVFQKVVMNQLQVYGINLMEVTPTNVALNKRKLDEKPLVIVYNSGKIQNELDENIEQFLEKAKEKQADIWPVAFSKEARESFVSYLMERRKLLIVQKMKIDQECQKKQYKNICILN